MDAGWVSLKLGPNSNNSYNYVHWKHQVESMLISRGLFSFIADDQPSKDKEWRCTDSMVKGLILSTISEVVLEGLGDMPSARALWLHLMYRFSQTYMPQPQAPPAPPFLLSYKGIEWQREMGMYNAAFKGDWDKTVQLMDQFPGLITSKLGFRGETMMHVAARTGNVEYMSRMINMTPEHCAIPLKDMYGNSLLHVAASAGSYQVAELVVSRYPTLLYHPNHLGKFPQQCAAECGNREILRLLITITSEFAPVASRGTRGYYNSNGDYIVLGPNPYAGNNGCILLLSMISYDYHDMVLQVLGRHPYIVKDNHSALLKLLKMVARYPKVLCEEDNPYFQKWSSHYQARKLIRQNAFRVVHILCNLLKDLDYEDTLFICKQVILKAAKYGHHILINEILEIFPLSVYFTNDKGQGVIHLGVIHRNMQIFNLLYNPGNFQYDTNACDNSFETIYHMAARLGPPHTMSLHTGAALQMQHELQWFEEAGRLVTNPTLKAQKNKNGETPSMIFTREHKDLKEKAEKFMKDTSNSCSIIAALIAAIVFAAAITFPGGDQASGYPMFRKSAAFTVFVVADVLTLFMSLASLVIFLSILTSRYSERDFLYALPKRLCLGLFSLFISILFLVIGFGAVVYLEFGGNKIWVLLVITALALIPMSSFISLHFWLLWDALCSTYGRGRGWGIFSHRSSL